MRLPTLCVSLLILTVGSSLLTSCVTMGKFRALKDEVAALESKVDGQDEKQATLENRVDNLKDLYRKEDDAIRERIANLAADYKDLQKEIGRAHGKQEEIDFKLREIAKHIKGLQGLVEDRFGMDSEALPKELPEKPEELFELGESSFKTGLTRKARAVYREFLKKHPDHDLTDDAQFMIGQTLFSEGRFTESVQEFKMVYDQYQTGNRYREAVLKIGLAYVRSNRCRKALKIYKFAAKTFKKTDEGAAAKKEVEELKKICK